MPQETQTTVMSIRNWPGLTEQERIQEDYRLILQITKCDGSFAASNDPERVRAYLDAIS